MSQTEPESQQRQDGSVFLFDHHDIRRSMKDIVMTVPGGSFHSQRGQLFLRLPLAWRMV